VTLRATLIASALLLVAAVPASAAEVSMRVAPAGGVRLGTTTSIAGVVTEGGAPLAGRTVRLEVRRHPFKGPWTARGTTVTRADGRYAFAPRFNRNHHVRARLIGLPAAGGAPPQPDVVTTPRTAYVLPAFTLSFVQRGTHRIRIRQTFTVPKDVRLAAPTRFYVGPCKPNAQDECTARYAPFAKRAETRRVRAGRYVARATVRIPASFGGRFSYVSCFAYSKGSGMGDPDQRCPRKWVKLSR
jgi:hypothetical protein